jgi:hypothetical protein
LSVPVISKTLKELVVFMKEPASYLIFSSLLRMVIISGLIKFGILFLDAKFAKNKNSKLPKLSGCLYV